MRGVLLVKQGGGRGSTYEEDCDTEVEGLGGLPQGLVGELRRLFINDENNGGCG